MAFFSQGADDGSQNKNDKYAKSKKRRKNKTPNMRAIVLFLK